MYNIRDEEKKMEYKHTRESEYNLDAVELLNQLNLSIEEPMKSRSVINA